MRTNNHAWLLAVLGGIFLGLTLWGITVVYCRSQDLLAVPKVTGVPGAASWLQFWHNLPGRVDWPGYVRKFW
ncbi:MAG: hypothetical protein ACUVTU_00555 [Desulfurispora sp.]|uniref:hypothetical protein n=1 Tax=Desulfurispora sp. TaxID=3014275 RepID=UPI004049B741